MSIADQLHEEGRMLGRQEGRQALFDAVRSLLIVKFQTLDAADEAHLRTATAELLERYVGRVLAAESIADVFLD